MNRAFFIYGFVFIAGAILQHFLINAGILSSSNLRAVTVVVGLVAFSIILMSGTKKTWRRFFASNRFSIPSISVLTILSIIGTLVVQKQPQDIFHSLGFSAVVGLGSGGLALTLFRRRKFTIRYSGAFMAHLGILLILAGATVGGIWSTKGRLNMHIGQSFDHFFELDSAGNSIKHPLDFVIRLDDFKLKHYHQEYRLMVYDLSEGKEERLTSIDPQSKQITDLKRYGLEVVDYFPDYVRQTIVEPTNDNQVAALGLVAPDKEENIFWFFDNKQASGGNVELLQGNKMMFIWEQARAEKFVVSLSEIKSPHLLIIGKQQLEIEVGQTISVPDSEYKIEIIKAYKDFVLDRQTRTPQERSDQPNNPALEIVIKDGQGAVVKKTYLFAKFPDFHDQGGPITLKMAYQYDPVYQAVLVGETKELWLLAGKKITAKTKIESQKMLQVGPVELKVAALHKAVRRSFVEKNASEEPNNPKVRVRLLGKNETALLEAKKPARLENGKVVVLAPKNGDGVRDYLSTLSVIKDGQVVLTETIEVNYPLEYNGWVFYQSDYRADDLTFSGFQVVKDPGYWIVVPGLVINMLGVFCAMFLPALIKRRKKKKPGEVK
jgi:hypothetical protein